MMALFRIGLVALSFGLAAVPSVASSPAFGGFVRVGAWAAARVPPNVKQIEARDGDNLLVEYPVDPSASWAYWRVGVDSENTRWRRTDGQSEPLPTRVLRPQVSCIVDLGTELGLEGINRDVVAGAEAPFEVVQIAQADQIPDDARGWEPVDLVIISTERDRVLEQLSPAQVTGLLRWVRLGGRVLLISGTAAPETFDRIAWLKELVPVEKGWGNVVIAESASIESFTSSQSRLNRISARSLPEGGKTILSGRSVDRQPLRLITEYLCGFGRVLTLGMDLNASPMAEWSDRNRFLRRLLPEYLEPPPIVRQSRQASNLGFDDLAGQVRAALDRPQQPRVPFSWLIGLLIAYLLVIGPLDYWVINRWWKRSWFGWLTFPAMVLGASVGFIHWGNRHRAAAPQVRHLEVVDIEPEGGLIRLFAWSQIEVVRSGTYDLRMLDTGKLSGGAPATRSSWWQAVAGREYGGLRLGGIGVGVPAYQLLTEYGVKGLPISSGGSKGIAAEWLQEGLEFARSELRVAATSEELRGRLVNPLSVDLRDGVLIYRNNAYLLPTLFPARSSIESLEQVTRKNFNWRLTRRKLLEGSSTSVPWDATLQEDLPRIMEIALFHGVAGGSSYTGLNHRPLGHLDLTPLLAHDRAILMGTASQRATQLVDGLQQPLGDVHEHLNYVRIVFPVEGTPILETRMVPQK